MNKKNIKNTGFTLVETLVAISIFTMSILGLMSILASGISNTNYAKQKIVAAYLAQEGIEYVRNMRDTYMLYDATGPQNGWDNGFVKKLKNSPALCQNAVGCYFNADNIFSLSPPMPMTQIALTACSGTCPLLKYDASTGNYGYTSGTNSNFIRKINISQINVNEVKISSTVSWTQGSGNYNIVFSENLFNWVE